jgi:hypothetical protein
VAFVLVSIFSMACGFYDLYKNVPFLREFVVHCFLPASAVFEWLEAHTQVRGKAGEIGLAWGEEFAGEIGLAWGGELPGESGIQRRRLPCLFNCPLLHPAT